MKKKKTMLVTLGFSQQLFDVSKSNTNKNLFSNSQKSVSPIKARSRKLDLPRVSKLQLREMNFQVSFIMIPK